MVLAFNRWDVSGIAVADFGLKKYIALEPRFAPKTGGRYAGNRFYKSKIFIVERLINKLRSQAWGLRSTRDRSSLMTAI